MPGPLAAAEGHGLRSVPARLETARRVRLSGVARLDAERIPAPLAHAGRLAVALAGADQDRPAGR